MAASSASVARPLASTLARIRSTGRPRPSSAISMMMWPPSWYAFSVMWPVSGLPAARRSAGISSPWSPLLRTMCVSGSLISSSTWRSSSVSAPSMMSSIFLSISRARSRTRRGSLFQALPIGCMRVFITPSCRSDVMCDSRCSGTVKPVFSCVRASCRSWLRVSTSSLTRVIRSSSTSTVTRMVCVAATGSPGGASGTAGVGCAGDVGAASTIGGGAGDVGAASTVGGGAGDAGGTSSGSAAAGGGIGAAFGASPAAAAFSASISSLSSAAGSVPVAARPATNRLDPVQRRQHQADGIRRHGQHAVPHLAEHVLGGVGHMLQPRQAEKTAGALDRVHQAEDQRQRLAIVRRALQLHQGDVQVGEVFVGLGQEVGEQIVHGSPLEPGTSRGGGPSWADADE